MTIGRNAYFLRDCILETVAYLLNLLPMAREGRGRDKETLHFQLVIGDVIRMAGGTCSRPHFSVYSFRFGIPFGVLRGHLKRRSLGKLSLKAGQQCMQERMFLDEKNDFVHTLVNYADAGQSVRR